MFPLALTLEATEEVPELAAGWALDPHPVLIRRVDAITVIAIKFTFFINLSSLFLTNVWLVLKPWPISRAGLIRFSQRLNMQKRDY